MRAEGWEVRAGAGAGAQDADASRAPGMFFYLFFICYTNVYITDLHCYPTTAIKANGHELKTATKKKKKDNEEGDEVGRRGQRVGR